MAEDRRRGSDPTADLRRLLRRGDPALDGSEPDREEVGALRRRVLAEHDGTVEGTSRPAPLGWFLRPAFAALLLVLVLGGGAVWWSGGGAGPAIVPDPRTAGTTAQETPGAVAADAALRTRQIHFETPGGNRIVWLLTEDEPTVGAPGPGGVP